MYILLFICYSLSASYNIVARSKGRPTGVYMPIAYGAADREFINITFSAA